MEISQAIQNCTRGIDGIVEIINNGGTSFYDSEEIAAQYAWDGLSEDVDQNGGDFNKEGLKAHMESLTDAGAEFDFEKAFEICLEELKKY